MPTRRSFERRLRVSLLLFSLLPSLALVGLGTYVLSQAVSYTESVRTWERVAASGREVLKRAETSGDAELARAAQTHRRELTDSVQQARRWEWLTGRAMILLPVFAVVLGLLFAWLAARAARRMARGLSRPVGELVGWAGLVARGEPLPAAGEGEGKGAVEFGVLRDAFRAMVAELDAARARELEAERARTWVAMARRVAHELKNPLTPMRFALRTLERSEARDPAEAEAREVIAAEAERLEELARAFAQFGRLPEGPRSEVDLREMLDYLLRTHLPEGVAPRLRVPVDLPRIAGHHDALSRAFANLLLNAADAVGAAGAVTVVVRAVAQGVEVRVLDDGPGIPPENLERVWEPDFSTKTRGTGLGLALVKQTVLAHGGRVGALNRPEGGAEFRVFLPVGDETRNGGAAYHGHETPALAPEPAP